MVHIFQIIQGQKVVTKNIVYKEIQEVQEHKPDVNLPLFFLQALFDLCLSTKFHLESKMIFYVQSVPNTFDKKISPSVRT